MIFDKNKLMNFIEKSIKFLFIIYFFGFIAWNYFLSRYGIFEYDFLQTRFLSAGLLWLLPFLVLLIISQIIEINNKWLLIFCLTCVVWFIFFPKFIFPKFPPYLGGAKPIPVSIIGSEDQIKHLSNFNMTPLPTGDNKDSVQTMPVCNIYQNKDFIIVGVLEFRENKEFVPMRVLTLKLDQIGGFSTTLGTSLYEQLKLCNKLFVKN